MKNSNLLLTVVVLLTGLFCKTNAQTVIMSGVGGHSTSQMLSRIDSGVFAHNPDTVIIMGGTNDMINSGKLATFSSYEANVRNIVNQVQEANAEIILVTVPPCIEATLLQRHDASAYLPDTPNERIEKANVILAKIAADENILLVDVYALINNNISLLSSDGVHPTTNGYKRYGRIVL